VTSTKAICLILVLTAIPALGNELHLLCSGGGVFAKTIGSTAVVTNSDGQVVYGSGTSTQSVSYEDEVSVEILGDKGRIRLPASIVPAIHGGNDGWYELKNLKIGENEILASAALNWINNPKIRIDRLAGTISINGRNSNFSGRCQSYDPNNVIRQF
jgi:hypothetical protein